MNIYIWLGIILGIILLLILLLGVFAYLVVFIRAKDLEDPQKIKEGHPGYFLKERMIKTYAYLDTLNSEEYTIINKRHHKLYATLYKVDQKERKMVVIFNHGWRGNGKGDLSFLNAWITREGYDLLVPMHEGHGKSEGKITTFGMRDLDDLKMWVDKVNDIYNHNCDIILYGVSMGGNIVLQASNQKLENVKAIIEDSGFKKTEEVLKAKMKQVSKLFGGIAFLISSFIARILHGLNVHEIDVSHNVKNSLYPILFIHGTKDGMVDYHSATDLYEVCTSPKELLLIEGAGHIKSFIKDEDAYLSKCRTFIEKHIFRKQDKLIK